MVDDTTLESKRYYGKFYFDDKLTESDKEFIISLYNDYLLEGLEQDLAYKKAIAVFKMFKAFRK